MSIDDILRSIDKNIEELDKERKGIEQKIFALQETKESIMKSQSELLEAFDKFVKSVSKVGGNISSAVEIGYNLIGQHCREKYGMDVTKSGTFRDDFYAELKKFEDFLKEMGYHFMTIAHSIYTIMELFKQGILDHALKDSRIIEEKYNHLGDNIINQMKLAVKAYRLFKASSKFNEIRNSMRISSSSLEHLRGGYAVSSSFIEVIERTVEEYGEAYIASKIILDNIIKIGDVGENTVDKIDALKKYLLARGYSVSRRRNGLYITRRQEDIYRVSGQGTYE